MQDDPSDLTSEAATPPHAPLKLPGDVVETSKAERLRFITEIANRDGSVSVEALTDALAVSRMTIHRYLDELQQRGVLRKVRGGASVLRSANYESDLVYRQQASVREKQQIALAAADLASEGDVVIIDDSTTALAVLPHLVDSVPMTIITNFLLVMEQLADSPDVKLVAVGGEYIPRYRSFHGVLGERALGELYADVLFASTSALRGSHLYHQDQRVVETKRAMMRAARARVLLMDHTKLGFGALHRLGSVADFTHVVVDARAEARALEQIRDTGVQLIVASSTSDT